MSIALRDRHMLFMVIEHFKGRDARPVYARYHKRGRMLPAGLKYMASWTEENFGRCFQLMETDDPSTFETWSENWKDLVDFEIVQVMTSEEASAAVDIQR